MRFDRTSFRSTRLKFVDLAIVRTFSNQRTRKS